MIRDRKARLRHQHSRIDQITVVVNPCTCLTFSRGGRAADARADAAAAVCGARVRGFIRPVCQPSADGPQGRGTLRRHRMPSRARQSALPRPCRRRRGADDLPGRRRLHHPQLVSFQGGGREGGPDLEFRGGSCLRPRGGDERRGLAAPPRHRTDRPAGEGRVAAMGAVGCAFELYRTRCCAGSSASASP